MLIVDDRIFMRKQLLGYSERHRVQRLVYNWVRPHWGLPKGTTPGMAMALYHRSVTMEELLTMTGFHPPTR